MNALKEDKNALEAEVQRLKDKAIMAAKKLEKASRGCDFYERHNKALKHYYQKKELAAVDQSQYYKVNYRSNFL